MTKRTCSVEGCHRFHYARGWCSTHYERWRRNGDLELRHTRPLWDRFWEKVDASGDCWEWTATLSEWGYGQVGKGRQLLYAHRVAWELLVGEIPDSLELDHLCRNPACVNPDHLEPVSKVVNVRRGSRAKLNMEKARTIRRLYATGSHTFASLGALFGVHDSQISRVVNNQRWRETADQT